jgi:hypothetical protein
MADSDKNIIISPQRGSATLSPTITFTGKGNDPITLRVTDADTGTLSFQGSKGQLFAISNSLSSGKIFSANYISGIPAIDVDASGLVRLAPLLGTVGIGTSSVTAGNIVDVGGNVRIAGNLSLTGNVVAPGGVYSAAQVGFYNSTFATNVRNPIWRFGNADGYGFSYFQGSAGVSPAGGGDTIGFHFGTATAAASLLQLNNGHGAVVNGNFGVTGNTGIGTTNPSYKLHVTGTGSVIQRDLYISGNTGGSSGNRLIVGNTDTSFTLQDGNLRSTIQIHGPYPVLSLNHTITSNTSHGPTIQFTCNGTGNQFVIGTTGNGSRLDIGTASYGDWNPHNGIAGHQGTTMMSFTASGNVGIGTTNPSIKLEVSGSFSDTTGALRQTGSGQFMIATYEGGSTPVCFSLRGTNTGGDTITNFGVLNLDRNGNGVGGGAGLHFRRQNSTNTYIEYGGLYSAIQVNTAGNESGFLAFCTTHNGANRQERIRILSDGNVGINTAEPLQKLDVRGKFLLAADATTSTHITQVPYTINNGTLSWEGSAGQLFSITNNLTSGSIYSVNDISGIPSIDVDANGTVSLAPYNGNVGIGITNPSYKLHVSGSIGATGNITAYASDKRLKENFTHIESPLEKVQKLNGYTFDWNAKSEELGFTPQYKQNDVGLIAQEVQEILPQAAVLAPFDRQTNQNGEVSSKSGENYLTIQYERLIPLLVEAIKEQQKQIDSLNVEIEKMKGGN